MKEKLQKLLELLQERAEIAEQKMLDLEPRYEDGDRTAVERYHYWEGVQTTVEMVADKIKTLL